MESVNETNSVSKKMLWAGYIASALTVLVLLISGAIKFVKPDGMELEIERLGWKMSQMTGLGILEIAVTIIYLIPRTAVLGAILISAYLGAATATHVRIGDPFFMTIILGVLAWLGLWFRDPRLRSLIPLRI